MRGSLKKIGVSIGTVVLMLASAAPTFAAAPSLDAINCIEVGGTVTCTDTVSNPPLTNTPHLFRDTSPNCGAGTDLGAFSGNGNGATAVDTPGTGTWYYSTAGIAPDGGGCHEVSVTIAAPSFGLTDLFSSGSMESGATAAVTQVGPYVLALFGILLIVGIAMNLLKRSAMKLIKEIDPNFNAGAYRKADAAQRRKEKVPKSDKKYFW